MPCQGKDLSPLRAGWLTGIFAAGLFVLLGNSVYSLLAVRTIHRNTADIEQVYRLDARLESFLSILRDAETGQRGYIITGREEYLEPYRETQSRSAAAMAQLRSLYAGSPERLRELDRLGEQANGKFREMEKALDARRNAGQDAAEAVVATGHGKLYMDQVRAMVRDMKAQNQHELSAKQEESERLFERFMFSRLLIQLTSISLFVCFFIFVRKELRFRAAALEKEKALRQSEESAQGSREASERRYKMLFDKSPIAKWLFDAESFRFLTANEAALRQYGYTREEFLALSARDIRPSEGWAAMEKNLQEVKAGGEPRGIWKHRRKDGSLIDVKIESHSVDWDGRRAILVSADDYSERLSSEQKLTEWKRRYEAAIQASGQVLFDWDPLTNAVTFANTRERLGYGEQEMGNDMTRWETLVHEDDRTRFRAEIERVLQTRAPFFLEQRLRKKDGSYTSVEVNGRFFLDESGRIQRMVGFITDVSERKLLEAQLLQSQKMEAVGRLAGGVAHDFNNMLGVVLGSCELLQSERNAPPAAAKRLKVIHDAAIRASELTRQLLAFSRQQILQPKVVDMVDVVRRMEDMLRRVIGEDVELRTFLHGAGKVTVDPSQIEQVLMNLAVNARDAMPDGGKLTIETECVELDEAYCRQHAAVKPGRYVRLAVSDTGIGMDASTQSHIFEPFFTTKSKDKGTGLGMATVFGIVSQSGGHIWLYSEPGQGATFKIYFPETQAQETAAPVVPDQDAIAGGRETILLAEDEPLYREMIVEALCEKGYNVLAAGDGNAALLAANAHPETIHLLVTDAVMPGMNGRRLAERLLAARPDIRVLYMSGYTTNVVVHHGVLDPGTEFLAKPFTPNQLFRKVRAILDARRSDTALGAA